MVVMPEYLKTSSKQNSNKPRIISEVKKNCLSKLKLSFTTSLQDFGKSKFTGQLLWKSGNSEWVLRTGEVRQGSLLLINKESSVVELRLPLRELNLRPCNAPRTFCLAESKGIRLLMFQALTEEEYEKWVRILAVELIRQTPLQNVRFLDILSIIRNKEGDKKEGLRRGRSEECIGKGQEKIWETPEPRSGSPAAIKNANESESVKTELVECGGHFKKIKLRIQNSIPAVSKLENIREGTWLRTQSMNNLSCPKEISDESGISSGDENSGDSISRNVEDFSFLSVRERKKFFESLNSGNEIHWPENSFLARSNSIGNIKIFFSDRNKLGKRKRTKSLHDLHKIPVREICQLFESRDRKSGKTNREEDVPEKNAMVLLTQRRLQRGERKLEKLKNQIAEVEESITVISEDIKSIGRNNLKRKEGLDLHAALERRLHEENSKLERLMEETSRVIKGNQRTIMKLERCNEKSSPESSFSP